MADDPKLAEFRDKNIELMKQLAELTTKYEGIDPATVAADRARLAELEKAKPHERITELETQLATEKAARTSAQAAADASILTSTVTAKFFAAGGRPGAAEFIVSKAKDALTIENGVIVGKVFDPNRPGVKLDVDGFIAMQVKESDYAFKNSGGGGADPKRGGATSGANELVNPTPQQLGEHAADVKAGRIKIVYTT